MMMMLRKFDYVYRDENEAKYIASVSQVEIDPTYDFTVCVKNKVYTCIVDKLRSFEWKIHIVCVSESDISRRKNDLAELSSLDDVYWNADSINAELHDYNISSAIAQGIAEIYRRFKGSL